MYRLGKHSGFTFGEMLVALSLVALLATMMIALVANDTGASKNLSIIKGAAAEITQAYIKIGSPTSASTSADVVNNMNFVRRITDSSYSTVTQRNSTTLDITACSAATPCIILQGGALLQYDADASFGTRPACPQTLPPIMDPGQCSSTDPMPNVNALRFLIDPDADGAETTTTLILFYSGRITTPPYINWTIVNPNNNLPTATIDPDYITDWVNG